MVTLCLFYTHSLVTVAQLLAFSDPLITLFMLHLSGAGITEHLTHTKKEARLKKAESGKSLAELLSRVNRKKEGN